MQWYEFEIQQLEKKISSAANPLPSVFYGSSTIRLWNDIRCDLKDPSVLNLGFGGSTLEACVYFFDRLFSRLQPRSLTVYAGDNDLGDGKSAHHVLNCFCALASKVEARFPGIPFNYVSIKPSPARVALMDSIIAANGAIEREIARRSGNCLFIPIFDAMLSGGKPLADLFEPDGLHMNEKGYHLWAQMLEPYRNRLFPDPKISMNTTLFDTALTLSR